MEYNTASSLFHYTKTIDVLKRILFEGIFANYCAETYSYNNRNEIVGIPMVSFCDIPLMRINGFSKRYGSYAIGLSKEWGLRNNISPVFYVSNEDIIAGLWFLRNYAQKLKNDLKELGSDGLTLDFHLKEGLIPGIADFINHKNAEEAMLAFYALIKKYESEHKGIKQINYIESEWRYVVKDGDSGVNWLWGEDSYNAWRRTGEKPKPSDELKTKRLRFSASDINHIIVCNEGERRILIDYFNSLKNIGGGIELKGEDKDLLISKINSIEQIGLDY